MIRLLKMNLFKRKKNFDYFDEEDFEVGKPEQTTGL